MTKPFTRQLSPMMKRLSGVKVEPAFAHETLLRAFAGQ
jgi:hypothetical protein